MHGVSSSMNSRVNAWNGLPGKVVAALDGYLAALGIEGYMDILAEMWGGMMDLRPPPALTILV